MAPFRVLLLLILGGLLVSPGAEVARAQDFRPQDPRPGFWRFGGPRFDGPRYDGPRYREPLPYGPPPDGAPPFPPDRRPPGPRACYSPAETRERVASLNLREPFELMRRASAFARAEALAGKLCRWDEMDIYEISLLRPDGRVVHVFMNAVTGQVVGGLNFH